MAALVVLLAVLAVYMQSLGGPFLWDDRTLILDAPLVEQGGSLGDFLNSPFWAAGAFHVESTSYYRPLVTLSFALDNAVHGGNSGGYHLTNVVLHATNALLVHALLRKHGARTAVAALLAIGWALLPRLAEAAAWISGRTDLLASLFTFAALLAWGPGLGRRIVAALFVGAGMFAKELAAAGVLAILVSVWSASRTLPWRRRLGATLLELAPLGVMLALYAVLRLRAVGISDEAEKLGWLGRVRAIFEAVGSYAAMLIDVWRPRALIGRVGAKSAGALAAGIAVVALLGALWRHRSRFARVNVTGLALFFAALLPVIHVVPIPLLTLAADRFLYLPTAGLALAFAPLVDRALGVERARWAAALALVGSLVFTTFARVGVWSNEVDFWVATYRETPATNNAAANELANVYYRAGLVEDALILSERALRYDDPQRATPSYNAALCLARLGRYDAARAHLATIRSKKRGSAELELKIALLEIRAGRFEAARSVLTPLVRHDSVARLLANRLPELEQARRALDTLDASSPAEQRATLATLLDEESIATRAWLEVLGKPNVPRPVADGALKFLVQRGDRQALASAASIYRSRYGSMDAELSGMVEVHLAELDRLIAARALLGLVGPERTQEIAVPGG